MLQADIGAVPASVAKPAAAGAAWTIPARIQNPKELPANCASFYPAGSRIAGEQGSVVMLVHVTEGGRIDGIEVDTSSGHAELDVATAACVTAYGIFVPRRNGNQPIVSWQRLKWTWRLEE